MNSNKIILEVKSLTKDYIDSTGYKLRLFENLSFTIHENEFTTILAPEGAGKSALLKILAKVDSDYSGEIIKDNNRLSPLITDTPTTLQWKTVKENIKFTAGNISDKEIKKAIDSVGLTGYEDFSPHPRSFGFRFRIELARALVHNPVVILIDDALANITEEEVRYDLLLKLRELNKIYDKTTFVYATNNITDGLFLADKFIILSKHPGRIVKKFEVSLPDKRDVQLVQSAEFSELREEVIKIYKETDNQFFSPVKV